MAGAEHQERLTAAEERIDESAIVGLLLERPEWIPAIREIVRPVQFADPHFADAYRVMLRSEDPSPGAIVNDLEASHPRGDGLRWGSSLCGAADGALVGSLEGLKGCARRIVSQWIARRERIAIEDAYRAVSNGTPSAEAIRILEATVEDLRRCAPRSKQTSLLGRSLTYREMLDAESPPVREILCGGIARAGTLGVLHGADGSRKSWEGFQLCIDAAVGRPHHGIQTPPEGIRAGFLSLEDDEEVVRQRLLVIAFGYDLTEEQEARASDNLHVAVWMDSFDLADPRDQRQLEEWIGEKRLELVVLDHLTAAHALPNEFDLRPVFLPLRRIARDAGVFLLAIHHDRKPAQGVKGRDTGASRGDSRFRAACRFSMHMREVGEGLVQAVLEKTTAGPRPKPFYLLHEKDRPLTLTNPPKSSREAATGRRDDALAQVREAGRDGITAIDLAGRLGVTTRTATRYLKGLSDEVEGRGATNRKRYRLRTDENASEVCRELE